MRKSLGDKQIGCRDGDASGARSAGAPLVRLFDAGGLNYDNMGCRAHPQGEREGWVDSGE